LLVFYLLVTYVILQFGWWAYLIYDLNKQILLQKQEIVQLETEHFDAPLLDHGVFTQELDKRFWMVIGEGSIFLLILILGALTIRKTFVKEMALSKMHKNFLLSITHELNSPIASIKLALQTLEKRTLDNEKRNLLVSNALSETSRLASLVDNILLTTKIDDSNFELHTEKIDLSELLQSNLDRSIAPKLSNHHLITKIEKGHFAAVDFLAFASILANLMENAVKYSPEKSTITVSLTSQQNKLIVAVADEGAGISEAEKARIFDKFYRVGNEDTRKTKGTGLGLYITKYLVRAHNGQLIVRDNQPKGTVFEVHINQFQSDATE